MDKLEISRRSAYATPCAPQRPDIYDADNACEKTSADLRRAVIFILAL